MNKKVIVYSQPDCPPCGWVKDFLAREGVAFVAKDVTEDESALAELSALGSRSTPTIVIDGKVFIGFEQEKLRAALNA